MRIDLVEHQPHEENIEKLLIALLKISEGIMSALSDLTDAVTANTTAVDAAVKALEAAPGGTPDSALIPLTATLQANNAALAAATPGATAPVPVPGPGVAFASSSAAFKPAAKDLNSTRR